MSRVNVILTFKGVRNRIRSELALGNPLFPENRASDLGHQQVSDQRSARSASRDPSTATRRMGFISCLSKRVASEPSPIHPSLSTGVRRRYTECCRRSPAHTNMTNTSSLELHSRGGWGSYLPHCFFIRASIEADLEPPSGIPSKNAVAIQAHEYVHMLHNVSTCAGLHLLLANLWLLRSLPHATDGDGHFRGPDFLSEPQRALVRQSYDWFRVLFGTISWRPGVSGPQSVASWRFAPVQLGQHAVVVPPQGFAVDLVSVDGEAVQKDGTAHQFSLALGYHFIAEGVAYEVEREIRRRVGVPEELLDADTPPYPYLMFGKLIDHWVGRVTTAAERIDLGAYALLDTSPARTLLDLSQSLARHAPQPGIDGHCQSMWRTKSLPPSELASGTSSTSRFGRKSACSDGRRRYNRPPTSCARWSLRDSTCACTSLSWSRVSRCVTTKTRTASAFDSSLTVAFYKRRLPVTSTICG